MAEASGAVRLVTLGVSASVAVEPVANRSSWGTVPPGRPCDDADLGEYAAPLVPAHSTPTLTPSHAAAPAPTTPPRPSPYSPPTARTTQDRSQHQVRAVVGQPLRVPLSLCDFEGLAVVPPPLLPPNSNPDPNLGSNS